MVQSIRCGRVSRMISNTGRVNTVAKVAIDEFDCAIDVAGLGNRFTGTGRKVYIHERS